MLNTGAIRINKYLASCGVCSRRDADRLIDAGRVMINGEAAGKGDIVWPGAVVTCDGVEVRPAGRARVFIWYKPCGVVCTERDPHAERTVATELEGRLPDDGRFVYIGRLDKESEGLLLLTNSGELAHRLGAAGSGIEKEYLVSTDTKAGDESLDRIRRGVYLKELEITTRRCEVKRGGGNDLYITLTEGKNRQIRRVCESEGLKVTRLVRVREAGIRLGDMRPGELRELKGEELEGLFRR